MQSEFSWPLLDKQGSIKTQEPFGVQTNGDYIFWDLLLDPVDLDIYWI